MRVASSDTTYINEGRIWFRPTKPFGLPYRIIIPKKVDCTNLLVPVYISASHVGFCAVRLESLWMQLGDAAGVAAAMSVVQNSDVQSITIKKLQKIFSEQGMITSLKQ